MLKDKKEIKAWLTEMNIKKSVINDDLSVDVKGNVNLKNQDLKFIPIQFGEVDGAFDCSSNELTTLIGAPHSVHGRFIASNNKLTSLIGIPKIINGTCFLNNNKLKKLDYFPLAAPSGINCTENPLTSISYEDLKNIKPLFETPFSLHLPLSFKNKLKKQGIVIEGYEDRILKNFSIDLNELREKLLVIYEKTHLNDIMCDNIEKSEQKRKTKLKL